MTKTLVMYSIVDKNCLYIRVICMFVLSFICDIIIKFRGIWRIFALGAPRSLARGPRPPEVIT